MGFKNQIGQVGQKLVDYSVHNSPTQIALQAIGNYGGGNRGPMPTPQIPVQGQLASNGARAGGGGSPAVKGPAPISRPAQYQRDRQNQGLLESLIGRYSKASQR